MAQRKRKSSSVSLSLGSPTNSRDSTQTRIKRAANHAKRRPSAFDASLSGSFIVNDVSASSLKGSKVQMVDVMELALQRLASRLNAFTKKQVSQLSEKYEQEYEQEFQQYLLDAPKEAETTESISKSSGLKRISAKDVGLYRKIKDDQLIRIKQREMQMIITPLLESIGFQSLHMVRKIDFDDHNQVEEFKLACANRLNDGTMEEALERVVLMSSQQIAQEMTSLWQTYVGTIHENTAVIALILLCKVRSAWATLFDQSFSVSALFKEAILKLEEAQDISNLVEKIQVSLADPFFETFYVQKANVKVISSSSTLGLSKGSKLSSQARAERVVARLAIPGHSPVDINLRRQDRRIKGRSRSQMKLIEAAPTAAELSKWKKEGKSLSSNVPVTSGSALKRIRSRAAARAYRASAIKRLRDRRVLKSGSRKASSLRREFTSYTPKRFAGGSSYRSRSGFHDDRKWMLQKKARPHRPKRMRISSS